MPAQQTQQAPGSTTGRLQVLERRARGHRQAHIHRTQPGVTHDLAQQLDTGRHLCIQAVQLKDAAHASLADCLQCLGVGAIAFDLLQDMLKVVADQHDILSIIEAARRGVELVDREDGRTAQPRFGTTGCGEAIEGAGEDLAADIGRQNDVHVLKEPVERLRVHRAVEADTVADRTDIDDPGVKRPHDMKMNVVVALA